MRDAIRTLAPAAALSLVVASLGGCGYALVGRTSSLPEDIHTIYVRNFENRTARSQIDQVLTQAVTDEFLTRQRYQVVSSETEADAVLSGAVLGFRVRPVTFAQLDNASGRATEWEILVSAQVEFKRNDNDEVLWKRDLYQFRETYDIDLDAQSYFDREDTALELVSDKFAETLVIDVLEGF